MDEGGCPSHPGNTLGAHNKSWTNGPRLARTGKRLIRRLPVSARFSRRRHIGRPGAFEKILGLFCPAGIIAVDRKQNSPLFDAPLVALGFVLRNAHADERSRNSADRTTDADAGQSSHDWAGGDKGAHPRDSQRSNANQPAQGSSHHRSGRHSGCGSFWSLGVLLHREIFGPLVLGKKDRDVSIAKALGPQQVDCVLNLGLSSIDSKCGCVFSGHCRTPFQQSPCCCAFLAALRMASWGLRMAIRLENKSRSIASILGVEEWLMQCQQKDPPGSVSACPIPLALFSTLWRSSLSRLARSGPRRN